MSMADGRIGFDFGLQLTICGLEKVLLGELNLHDSLGQDTKNFRSPRMILHISSKIEQSLSIYPPALMTCHIRRD
jgi:hypothetical protein